MNTQKKHIPNYLGFGILMVLIAPLIFVEFSGNLPESESGFLYEYKSYFGWITMLEFILFAFVCADSIIHYDEIPVMHKLPTMMLNLFIGVTLLLQFFSWLGYFNGGLLIFTWLSA